MSILIPTLNEASHIDACLRSVLDQTYPLREVLVLDGGSTDGTREKVSRFVAPVRLVDNPGRGPAAAMNTGIAASTGEVICRMDAHTVFAPDYVSCCVDVLLETGAEVVGGPMRPRGSSSFGRAVAAVTSSPIAMPGRFHFGTTRSDVDTVYLGAWRRSTLVEARGFDAEHFPRVGEDNELNYRIRRRGGRVVLDPSLRSTYSPRESPKALWHQYHRYGLAKATSIGRHGALPSWRPVAPAALVAVAVIGIVGEGPGDGGLLSPWCTGSAAWWSASRSVGAGASTPSCRRRPRGLPLVVRCGLLDGDLAARPGPPRADRRLEHLAGSIPLRRRVEVHMETRD